MTVKVMKEKIETWELYNQKTQAFLEILTDGHLTFKPFEGSKTLGYLLCHVADVREVYVKAIEGGGGISWDDKREDPKLEKKVQFLRDYYRTVDDRFNKLTNELDFDKVINWGEMGDPTVAQCIQYMTEHEIFFHGLYSLYIEGLGLDFDIKL